MTVSDAQITALRTESARAGDTRQEMLCVLALGGPEALRGAEAGTDAAILIAQRVTRETARARCASAIADASAEMDDDAE